MDPFTWTCQCWSTNKNLQQLCADIGCSLEDLPRTMIGTNGERESGRSVPAAGFDDDDDYKYSRVGHQQCCYSISLIVLDILAAQSARAIEYTD